jgi:hypothetical protein
VVATEVPATAIRALPSRRSHRILFSNGSRGDGSVMSDIDAVGCLRSLRAHSGT